MGFIQFSFLISSAFFVKLCFLKLILFKPCIVFFKLFNCFCLFPWNCLIFLDHSFKLCILNCIYFNDWEAFCQKIMNVLINHTAVLPSSSVSVLRLMLLWGQISLMLYVRDFLRTSVLMRRFSGLQKTALK